MSRGKHASRRTKNLVRKPATKFAHLRKRMEKHLQRGGPKAK